MGGFISVFFLFRSRRPIAAPEADGSPYHIIESSDKKKERRRSDSVRGIRRDDDQQKRRQWKNRELGRNGCTADGGEAQ